MLSSIYTQHSYLVANSEMMKSGIPEFPGRGNFLSLGLTTPRSSSGHLDSAVGINTNHIINRALERIQGHKYKLCLLFRKLFLLFDSYI